MVEWHRWAAYSPAYCTVLYCTSTRTVSNGPSGGQIMHYGPSGGIVIFDTKDSNRKSHEIGESAINPSQSIICNCTVLVP